jgi:hypothetical protein
MTPERAADKEKRALFRAMAFFLSDLKLGMTKLLIVSISLSYPRISSWSAEGVRPQTRLQQAVKKNPPFRLGIPAKLNACSEGSRTAFRDDPEHRRSVATLASRLCWKVCGFVKSIQSPAKEGCR